MVMATAAVTLTHAAVTRQPAVQVAAMVPALQIQAAVLLRPVTKVVATTALQTQVAVLLWPVTKVVAIAALQTQVAVLLWPVTMVVAITVAKPAIAATTIAAKSLS